MCLISPEARLSILPPVAIRELGPDGKSVLAKTRCTLASPLLVLVNSKSGDNQGVKVLRRFKRLLNPAQVFDLMSGGPDYGLEFFKIFDSFRVLVCGGDGSVGWVLGALDKLELHAKCQLGVVPLGTGNDLARVLGWGNAFDENTQLQILLEKFERAHTEMMDRWSILMHEGPTHYTKVFKHKSSITQYEDSVASHLSKILSSDDHSVVITSAKVLCETVKDFLTKVSAAHETSDQAEEHSEENTIAVKCGILQQKLDNLLQTLQEESVRAEAVETSGIEPEGSSSDSFPDISPQATKKLKHKQFVQNEALMSRANSLKKAIRQIIEHAEKAVDEQNRQTMEQRKGILRKKKKFYQRRSKTTPGSLLPTSASRQSSYTSPPASPFSLVASSAGGHEEDSSTTDLSSPQISLKHSVGQVMFDIGEFGFHGPSSAGPSDRDRGFFDSDSTVPEDPTTAGGCIGPTWSRKPLKASGKALSLQPPSMVTVQPPTPVCITPRESPKNYLTLSLVKLLKKTIH